MLCCLCVPTSGDAVLLGDSILSDTRAVKQKINISPQETAVARNLSTRENLELIAGIHGFNRKTAQAKADEMLDSFDLAQVAEKKASKLSGGMQRRLSVAMALISDPQILFLDEPTIGLDVIARRELWSAIRELKGKITIILTTHYMEEAEALSDRVGVIVDGRLKAIDTSSGLMSRTGAKNLEDAFVTLATDSGVDG